MPPVPLGWYSLCDLTKYTVFSAGSHIRAKLLVPLVAIIAVDSLASSVQPAPVRVQCYLGVYFEIWKSIIVVL